MIDRKLQLCRYARQRSAFKRRLRIEKHRNRQGRIEKLPGDTMARHLHTKTKAVYTDTLGALTTAKYSDTDSSLGLPRGWG